MVGSWERFAVSACHDDREFLRHVTPPNCMWFDATVLDSFDLSWRCVQTSERAEAHMSKRKAVVLLSGGLDSTTVLAIAKSQGYEAYALSFRYGQRHIVELEAAARVAKAQGVAQHVVCDI